MISTTVGTAYPALYAVGTHATMAPSDDDDWVVDTYRCVTIVISGGPWALPTTWAYTKLPPCLTLDPATGRICGAPMQVGVYPITIIVTDATGRTMTLVYTITVRPKP